MNVDNIEARLAGRVAELEAALARVKHLQGLLPICAYCKKVRDDQNGWQLLEKYIELHTEAHFTHGVCPDCRDNRVRLEIARFRLKRTAA
jgi:hypothetical protein